MATASSFVDTDHGALQAMEAMGFWSSDVGSTHWWQIELGAVHTNVQVVIDWTTDLQIGSIAAQEYAVLISALSPAVTWTTHWARNGQWGDCEMARTDKVSPIQAQTKTIRIEITLSCHPEYVGINEVTVKGYPIEKASPVFQLTGNALASSYVDNEHEPGMATMEPFFWLSIPAEAHWWMVTFDSVYSQTDVSVTWADDASSGASLAARKFSVEFQGDVRVAAPQWITHFAQDDAVCESARVDLIPWNPDSLQRLRIATTLACAATKVVGIAVVTISGHAMDKELYAIKAKGTTSSTLDDAHGPNEVHTTGGHWSSGEGHDTNWWKGELPAAFKNADLQIYWATWWEGVSMAPKYFEILISIDGVTWTTVYTKVRSSFFCLLKLFFVLLTILLFVFIYSFVSLPYTKTRTEEAACVILDSVAEIIPVIKEPFNFLMINMTTACEGAGGYVGIKEIVLLGEPGAEEGTAPPRVDDVATSSTSSSGNAGDALDDSGWWLSGCCDSEGRPGRHWWALDLSAEYAHLVVTIRWTTQAELGDTLGTGAPSTYTVEVAHNPPVEYTVVFKYEGAECDASAERTDTIPKITKALQWIRIASSSACRSDNKIALSRVSVAGYPLSMSGLVSIVGGALSIFFLYSC